MCRISRNGVLAGFLRLIPSLNHSERITKAMNDSSEEIYKEYKKETDEILQKMRSSFESLGEASGKDGLNEIMRCSHKIKGVAGMMNFSHVAELAEEMELLSKLLVEEKIQLKPEVISVLSESINLLARYIETDYDKRDATLLEKLRKLIAFE